MMRITMTHTQRLAPQQQLRLQRLQLQQQPQLRDLQRQRRPLRNPMPQVHIGLHRPDHNNLQRNSHQLSCRHPLSSQSLLTT